MNKTVLMLALVSILSLGLLASNSYAAGTTRGSGFRMFNSYDLIGVPVRDSHGEIGFVNEVMVDNGGHALAVIYHSYQPNYDPFAWWGTPVPFQELTISKAKGGREIAILKTDLKHLNLAPSLDSSKMESRRYEASIYRYYGIQPYWFRSGTPAKGRFMEVDSHDLVGAAVEDSCGKVIGVVNEVMVDSGGHAFAVINHGDYDIFGENGVNTPVPFQELRISKTKDGQEIVFLKTDTEHLDFAPYLDLAKINSRQYEADIYEYYGIQPYWTRSGESSFHGMVAKVDEAKKDFDVDLHQQRMVFYLDKHAKIIESREKLPFVDMATDTPFDWLWVSVRYNKGGSEWMAEKITVSRLW